MTPIAFAGANKLLTAPPDSSGIAPLPVHTDGKQCLSCWSLTWRQRLQVLLHGRVWLCTLTGSTQPPVWLDASKSSPITIPTNQNR